MRRDEYNSQMRDQKFYHTLEFSNKSVEEYKQSYRQKITSVSEMEAETKHKKRMYKLAKY